MSELETGQTGAARLVLATHNAGKVREFRHMLAPYVPDADTAVVSAADIAAPDVVEDGDSFEANALLKARAIAAYSGLPVISDDSGLAVDIMGGSPGIFSARWSGRHGDDDANLRLLLNQLSDVPDGHRSAKFVCVAVLAFPDGTYLSERGEMRGTLAREPRGDGGFGYDPIFIPEGLHESAAQISAEHKNSISHRAKAVRALLPSVVKVFAEDE